MEFVLYFKLFFLCQIVVYYGGSGIVGMVLRCGILQIVCLFMFDQSYWGDKVFWMGVGEFVGYLRLLRVEVFVFVFVNVGNLEVRNMVVLYGKMLLREDGLDYVV